MSKNLIRLTESDLRRIVEKSVANVLSENEMEEGWFGDKWNQTKSAVGTAFNKDGDSRGKDYKMQERIGILKVN